MNQLIMLTEDYLMRYIRIATAALARILGLKQSLLYTDALFLIDQTLEQLLGLKADLYNSLDDASILALLTEQGATDTDRLVLIADLTREQADIYQSVQEPAQSRWRFYRALNFYLEAQLRGGPERVPSPDNDILELSQQLGFQGMPQEIMFSLYAYFEQTGRFALAGDALAALLAESGPVDDLVEEARRFYSDLLTRPEKELIDGRPVPGRGEAPPGRVGRAAGMNRCLAYFISPHGFGHAARSCAVMEAIHGEDPSIRFEIIHHGSGMVFPRLAGRAFRLPCLPGGYWPGPERSADRGYPRHAPAAWRISCRSIRKPSMTWQPSVRQLGCQRVVCDIAPLGIAVARQAGIPSILVENFTWDWIYSAYLQEEPGLSRPIALLAELFRAVDCHIQTEPVCRASPRAALTAPPASRQPKSDPAVTRAALGIPPGDQVVLITMGGIPADPPFLDRLYRQDGVQFVIPVKVPSIQVRKNCILLPHHSHFYHPDLMQASDAVVGKTGYSTLAEAYQSGVPFGYLSRPRFPESGVLAEYVQRHMQGFEIPPADLESGDWLGRLPELLSLPRAARSPAENGAVQIAQAILDI